MKCACVPADVLVLEPGSASDEALRRRFVRENPDMLKRFSADLLPLMLQVYGGTVVAQVTLACKHGTRALAGTACRRNAGFAAIRCPCRHSQVLLDRKALTHSSTRP